MLSDKDFDLTKEMEQQEHQDLFFQTAAKMISDEQKAEFDFAQADIANLPPETVERLRKISHDTIYSAQQKKKRKKLLRNITRVVAAIFLAIGLSTSALYVTVDAARAAINNFFLEQLDDHAVIRGESGCTLPADWNGPITPEWVPARYTEVTTAVMGRTYSVIYRDSSGEDILLLYVWNINSVPSIDIENMVLEKEISVQEVPTQIYYKETAQQRMMILTKNDCTVQIRGNLTQEELIEIAENIKF